MMRVAGLFKDNWRTTRCHEQSQRTSTYEHKIEPPHRMRGPNQKEVYDLIAPTQLFQY